MTKNRQHQLSELFGFLYKANMTAPRLVEALAGHVALRPKRARRDNLWGFNRLKLPTRLSAAAEYISWREDQEKNRPAIHNVVYLDVNHPGSNLYDAQPGEWNLVRHGGHGNGRLEWQAVPLTQRRNSVCFSTTDLSEFYPALVKLAVGLHAAFLVSERTPVLQRFRAVIVAPGETRFQQCGPNFFSPAVPPGTALLFPGEQEETGRIVTWPDGDVDRYAITIWGKFFAAQIDSGFPALQSVPASP